MSFLNKTKSFISTITKRDIINFLIIITLFIGLIFSINKCNDTKLEYKNNIEALNDTIRTYQDKNGNLVATKLGFESDMKTLKLLNEDLYNQIKTLKTKKSPVTATYIQGVIENPKQDTIWKVDSFEVASKGFDKRFDFNNKWRSLEGNIFYHNDSAGINITRDQVVFDYTIAMDKSNNIYVRSANPYVKYNQISGFKIPTPKRKRWSLGPAVGFGYNPIQNKASLSVGISLNYGILQW